MKSRIKLVISAIAVLFTVLAFNTARAVSPTVTINYSAIGLVPGSTINVPLVMTGSTVGSFQLVVQYDRDVLTYQSTTEGTHGAGLFTGTPASPGYFVTTANDTVVKVSLAYIGGSPGYTYSATTVATLNFTFNGGSTNLTFYNIATLTSNTGASFTYVKANPFGTIDLTTVYNNGSASGGYGDLHSVSGGGNWFSVGTWVEGKKPSKAYNCRITGSEVNQSTLANPQVCQNLIIEDAGQLTLNASKTLTVNGDLTIECDVTGSGSFVDQGGTLTVAGTTSVQRYMAGNWVSGVPTSATTFHEISSPVSGGTINTFLGDLLNKWDEPSSTWQALTIPTSTPLNVGQGYSTAPHTPGGVKTFTGGTLNTGDLAISGLTRTGAIWTGYNLLGNIYPSALWFDSWSMTNLDATVWVWDPSSGNYKLGQAAGNTLPGNIVPAENGFFVHVNAGTGSMTIPNAKRVHSAQAFYKNNETDVLFLSVNGNGYGDVMSVVFNSNAGSSYDPMYDAYKLAGLAAAPQLYSILSDNTDLTINALPSVSSSNTINLGFKVGVSGSNTITASNLESFSNGTTIFLQDKLAGQTIDLRSNPVYTFNATPSDPEKRFDLLFNPVGIDQLNQYSVMIYSNEKDIYVNVPMAMQGTIFVYNLIGNQITSKPVTGNSLNKLSVSNPGGYYIVKVIGDSGVTTGKVYIR